MGNYSYLQNGKLMTNKGGKIEDEDEITKIINEQGTIQSHDDMLGKIAPVQNEFTGGASAIAGSTNFGAKDKTDEADKDMAELVKGSTGSGSGSGSGSGTYTNTKNYADVIGTIASSYYPSQEASPVYYDKYGDSIEAAVKSLAAKNYENFTKSATYQELVNRFGNAGNLAMQDTIGQVSARTGGMASTYAQAAGQQSYNQYMQSLEDAAQSQYAAERNEIQNDIANLRALRSDDLSEFNTKYNLWNADKQYQDTQAEKARQNIIDYLVTYGGNPEDINEDLLTQAGYGNEQLQAFKNAYKDNTTTSTGSFNKSLLDEFQNLETATPQYAEAILNELIKYGVLEDEDQISELYEKYVENNDGRTATPDDVLNAIGEKFDKYWSMKDGTKYLQSKIDDGTITKDDADYIIEMFTNRKQYNRIANKGLNNWQGD